MNYEETEKFLEEHGWVLECFSPFEISMKDAPEARATGYAAQLVIDALREQDDQEKWLLNPRYDP